MLDPAAIARLRELQSKSDSRSALQFCVALSDHANTLLFAADWHGRLVEFVRGVAAGALPSDAMDAAVLLSHLSREEPK